MALAQPTEGDIDLTTEASRTGLARLIMRLFDRWQLNTATQLNFLGLSPTNRAMLGRYRRGTAYPSTRDLLDRIGWLLAIHKALRLLYPYNESLRYSWIKRRHAVFDHHSPLEVMMDEGLIGIAKVARYLDWQRGR